MPRVSGGIFLLDNSGLTQIDMLAVEMSIFGVQDVVVDKITHHACCDSRIAWVEVWCDDIQFKRFFHRLFDHLRLRVEVKMLKEHGGR